MQIMPCQACNKNSASIAVLGIQKGTVVEPCGLTIMQDPAGYRYCTSLTELLRLLLVICLRYS
jgi:hypothetical protein